MANPSKGLGRGLAALLGDDVMTPEEEKTSLYLPISQVESCASQPRKQFDPDALADLADSIREHGIIQPLTVRKLQSGYYQIIAGERRWRAARMAGLSEVPAIVLDDGVGRRLLHGGGEGENSSGVSAGEPPVLHHGPHGGTQLQQAHCVGYGGPGLAHPLGRLLLGHVVLLHQRLVALGFLHGVQILPLEVLDHGQLHGLAVVGLDDDGRHLPGRRGLHGPGGGKRIWRL